ncbi:hypothetical protein Bbelb_420450 [Branchiostoma belcheri]|nr:hypothetical protein Bbelb_420450 [Branchiostoma belcheri]
MQPQTCTPVCTLYSSLSRHLGWSYLGTCQPGSSNRLLGGKNARPFNAEPVCADCTPTHGHSQGRTSTERRGISSVDSTKYGPGRMPPDDWSTGAPVDHNPPK